MPRCSPTKACQASGLIGCALGRRADRHRCRNITSTGRCSRPLSVSLAGISIPGVAQTPFAPSRWWISWLICCAACRAGCSRSGTAPTLIAAGWSAGCRRPAGRLGTGLLAGPRPGTQSGGAHFGLPETSRPCPASARTTSPSSPTKLAALCAPCAAACTARAQFPTTRRPYFCEYIMARSIITRSSYYER